MNKTLKIFTFYFSIGLLLFAGFYVILYINISQKVDAELKVSEESIKGKPKPTFNPIIERLESKRFFGILDNSDIKLHKDTLYFLWFPSFQSNRDIYEIEEIKKMALSQQNKPFRLMCIAHQKDKDELRKWCDNHKVDLKKCYITPDLRFISQKIVVYENQERYSIDSPIYWSHQNVIDFFQQLYNKK
jgi:hypothetical protein